MNQPSLPLVRRVGTSLEDLSEPVEQLPLYCENQLTDLCSSENRPAMAIYRRVEYSEYPLGLVQLHMHIGIHSCLYIWMHGCSRIRPSNHLSKTEVTATFTAIYAYKTN